MTTVDTAYLTTHGAEIAAARERIAPYARRTPLLATDLDERLRLKPESFQVTGSFKVRGAFNAVLQLKAREPGTKGVIAASSGNHAQALALAARTVGLAAVILIPADANPLKVEATKAQGAEVIQDGISFANREQRLHEEAEARGFTIVHPYDNWDIIHGAGTAAAEALDDDPSIRTVVTPVGGGGLLTGSVLAAKARDPRIRVIGVEPKAADDARRTFETGTIQRLPADPQTLADGVRTMSIGERNFEVMVDRHLLDDIVTLSEDEIAEGTVAAWLRCKLALEPTGSLPLAAWLTGRIPAGDGPVALVLSGGNADPRRIATLLTGGR
jgi:threonine dehydratase